MSRASFGVVLLTAFMVSTRAYAHGGPPAIESVLASDDDGPWLAELSEGYALRGDDGGWSFLCPAVLGADTPPTSATIGDVVWISGGMDLYRLTAGPLLAQANEPSLSIKRVLALDVIDGALLALRTAESGDGGGGVGSELIRFEDGSTELVFQDLASFWNVAVVQPGRSAGQGAVISLARIAGNGFELLELTANGEEIARASTPWPSPPLSLRLSAAGDEVFVHVYDNLGYTLVHAATRGTELNEGVVVAEAQGPMRGPVQLGDELLFTQDERLVVYRDGAAELSDSVLGSEALTCLSPLHACTASRLYAVDSVEQAGEFDPDLALLDLARLAPPVLRPEDPELARYCTAQWLVFQGDLARVGISNSDGGVPVDELDAGDDAGPTDAGEDASLAGDASAEEATSSSACAISGRTSAHRTPHLLSLGVCATAIYARRRRAQSGARA